MCSSDLKVDRVLIVSRTSSYMRDPARALAFEHGLQAAVQALVASGKTVWLLDPVPGYDYPVPDGRGFVDSHGGWLTTIMDDANVEVIAGVNLPMLIKLASVRTTESLAEAVASAQAAGRKYINVASRLLSAEAK